MDSISAEFLFESDKGVTCGISRPAVVFVQRICVILRAKRALDNAGSAEIRRGQGRHYMMGIIVCVPAGRMEPAPGSRWIRTESIAPLETPPVGDQRTGPIRATASSKPRMLADAIHANMKRKRQQLCHMRDVECAGCIPVIQG